MSIYVRRLTRFSATFVTVFLAMLVVSQTVAVAYAQEAETITVPEFICSCFDGSGYADTPWGTSDLESTLNAITLLYRYDSSSWGHGTWKQLDSIVERYAGMQSVFRGGFGYAYKEDNGTIEPDMQTTALVLETLKILGRLDAVDLGMAERYLWSSFRCSLRLNNWFSEGDPEFKYWSVRAAHAIGGLNVIGIQELGLDNIVSPDANRADFPLIESYITWNKTFYGPSNLYGGGFDAENYESKILGIDVFTMVLENDSLGATIIPCLIDADTFIADLRTSYDVEVGLFVTDGKLDTELSLKNLHALHCMGRTADLFMDDMGAIRLGRTVTSVKNSLVAINSDARTASGISEILSLSVIEEILNSTVDVESEIWVPEFTLSCQPYNTGIVDWTRRTNGLHINDELWSLVLESIGPSGTEQSAEDMSFIIILSLSFALCVVLLRSNNKHLGVLFCLFAILLFMGEYVFGIDQVSSMMSSIVGALANESASDSWQLDMSHIGTAWLQTYGQPDSYESEQEGIDHFEMMDSFVPSVTEIESSGFEGKFGIFEAKTKRPLFRISKDFYTVYTDYEGKVVRSLSSLEVSRFLSKQNNMERYYGLQDSLAGKSKVGPRDRQFQGIGAGLYLATRVIDSGIIPEEGSDGWKFTFNGIHTDKLDSGISTIGVVIEWVICIFRLYCAAGHSSR